MSFKRLIERNNKLKELAEHNNVEYGLIKDIMDLLVYQCKYDWEESFNNIKEQLEHGVGNKELKTIKTNLARTIIKTNEIRCKEESERAKRIKERRF